MKVSQIFIIKVFHSIHSLKELKKVTTLLGATLTKDEVDEFMKEADVVNFKCSS